jgi:PhzF family phenazine biosynthesis protein
MRLPIFQVDAFADRLFRGNPAAVVPVPAWPEDEILQAVAAENNLSETAFIRGEGEDWQIRWFTPGTEVDLCGHATLASAWVICNELAEGVDHVRFQSASGELEVTRDADGRLELDFPALPPGPGLPAENEVLGIALGAEPEVVMQAKDCLAVFRQESQVRELRPDVAALARLDCRGVIVTAPGDDCDFVSRFFAPKVGVPEDPVTGSAHCTLAPDWARRLEVSTLHARQISARGGDLFLRYLGERVRIAGHAVPYLRGVIEVPE